MKQKYANDIQSFVDSVPYGDVVVRVTRINRHTSKVATSSTETLRYMDNDEAFKDIGEFLSGLVDSRHSGEVQFQLVMKEGRIHLLGIKTTKEINYEKR